MNTVRLKPADFFFERLIDFTDEDGVPNTEMIVAPAIYKNKIVGASSSLDLPSEFIGLAQNANLNFTSFDFADESYNIYNEDVYPDTTWVHRSFCDLYHLQNKKEICEVERRFYAVFKFYYEGYEHVLLEKTPNGYDFPSTEDNPLVSRDSIIRSIYQSVFKIDGTITMSYVHDKSEYIDRRIPMHKTFYKNRREDVITEYMVLLAAENIVPILISDILSGRVEINCECYGEVLTY